MKGKTNDRRKNPGTVKSGRITADAMGSQAPIAQVSFARKGGKKR